MSALGLRACQACFARDDSCTAGTADLQFGRRSSLTLLWAAEYRIKLWKQTVGAQSRVAASTCTHGGREGERRWLPFQCWPACNPPQYCGKAHSIPRPHSYDGATCHICFRSSLVLCILVQSWSWTGNECSLSGHNALGYALGSALGYALGYAVVRTS